MTWYQVLNLVTVAGVMAMFPSRSQAGRPEKMESERPCPVAAPCGNCLPPDKVRS